MKFKNSFYVCVKNDKSSHGITTIRKGCFIFICTLEYSIILSFRRSEICKVKIRCRYTRNDYLSCCSFDKLQ